MTEQVSEQELKNAGALMSVYCGLCGAALAMTILLSIFGEKFLNIF